MTEQDTKKPTVAEYTKFLARVLMARDAGDLLYATFSDRELDLLPPRFRGAIEGGACELIDFARAAEIDFLLNGGWRCDCDAQEFCIQVADRRTRGDGLNIELAAITAEGALAAGILAILYHRQTAPDGQRFQGTEDVVHLKETLLKIAPGHQGGHSDTGRAIADALGVPFPISMDDLRRKAGTLSLDVYALWPWLEGFDRKRALAAANETTGEATS